jgi:PAS domain S-box-containing protein
VNTSNLQKLRQEVTRLRQELAQTQEQLTVTTEALQLKIKENESLTEVNQQLQQEISKRQQTETTLRESEAQYLAILEDQTELITRFLPDGTLLFVNQAYCHYYGKTREELIGHTYEPVIFPEDLEKINQMLQSLSLEHPVATIEHRAIVKGEIRWMQWVNRAIFDQQGNFLEFQSVGRDITERVKVQQALQAKTEELDRFFSVALDLLCILDFEGYFRRVNSQWEETLGYSVEEIEGTRFFEYIHPEDLEKTQATMSVLTDQQQKITNFVNRYRCQDGSYRWIEWRCVPVENLIYSAARDITHRIEIEAALQTSEARFRAFFEQAAVGVTLCNQQGRFIEFNQRFCDILGYSVEQLKKLTFKDITHPEEVERDWRSIQELWAGKIKTFAREKRYICPNGQVKWASLTVSLARNAEGIPEHTIAIIIDISDRMEADAARQEKEQLFRTIFEKGPLGMAIVSLDYHFLKANIMLCQMLGYSSAELKKLTFADLTHPDDLDQDLHLVQQLYAGEIPYYKLQKRYLTKNKEIRWVMLTGSIIRDQQGNPLYYLAMIEDISNIYEELHLRQQAEAVLRKYERIVSATIDGISLVDRNYIYQAVNQAYLNWHHKSYDEIIGHSVSEILGDETFKNTIKPYLEQCFSGKTVQYEMWYNYENIGPQFLSVTYAPSFEEDQTISGAVVSVRNITELKQKQQIEASLQEKEVLLKEIHHRVKNNLQVIHSLLNLQARSLKDPLICDKFKESQNRVQSMALIHEHLYRSESFSQIDLSKYLHELVKILCTSYKVNNLYINVNIDMGQNFFLDIDTAVPCGLIINELVSNALKYAFDSDKKGTLYIGTKSDDDQNLVLTIADNGKGLSPDFDWEQSPTLGLKLVKNLTNQLRGTMTIKQESGTKITLVLTRIKNMELSPKSPNSGGL